MYRSEGNPKMMAVASDRGGGEAPEADSDETQARGAHVHTRRNKPGRVPNWKTRSHAQRNTHTHSEVQSSKRFQWLTDGDRREVWAACAKAKINTQ